MPDGKRQRLLRDRSELFILEFDQRILSFEKKLRFYTVKLWELEVNLEGLWPNSCHRTSKKLYNSD